MFSNWKRKRAAKRLEPGDGRALKRFRWWQWVSRSLFHIPVIEEDGLRHRWSVDVGHWGDSSGFVRAHLYRDGKHHAGSKVPAIFPIPGGRVEVATSGVGLKRCHYVADSGEERQLLPDPASAEGRRAQLELDHPVVGRAIGVASVLVLVVAVALGTPQLLEDISQIGFIADNFGTFTSPFRFPGWLNTALVVAAIIATTERALRLRYHWLLDGGVSVVEV